MSEPSGVVITGVYGAGKSSVVEEIAGILDEAGTPYAALDLDWLWWFDTGQVGDDGALAVLGANLESVVRNYLGVGVRRFAMAWAIRNWA